LEEEEESSEDFEEGFAASLTWALSLTFATFDDEEESTLLLSSSDPELPQGI